MLIQPRFLPFSSLALTAAATVSTSLAQEETSLFRRIFRRFLKSGASKPCQQLFSGSVDHVTRYTTLCDVNCPHVYAASSGQMDVICMMHVAAHVLGDDVEHKWVTKWAPEVLWAAVEARDEAMVRRCLSLGMDAAAPAEWGSRYSAVEHMAATGQVRGGEASRRVGMS